MQVFYCDEFPLPLPDAHTFPVRKYRMLRDRVVASGVAPPESLIVAARATREELLRAHDPAYLDKVFEGTLSAAEVRELGFPWSPEMLERSLRSCGATVAACRSAAAEGIAVHLSGGTHHAFRDHGAGYCVFNDAAVAARAVQAEGIVDRVLILDCDVHQGDGTAAILQNDPTIYTFSIHGAKNYPLRKQRSDLDVELPDGVGDALYLEALAPAIDRAMAEADPDLVIYLAGADPHEGDRLGRLKLTKAGLAERDRLVFGRLLAGEIPVAVTMAGGYGRIIEDSVEIQAETVAQAARFSKAWGC